MGEDPKLILRQSEVGSDRNDVEEENLLCHSQTSLNLKITRKRKKFEKIYYHQDLSMYFNLMLNNLSQAR
jgi:hypothetical protein